MFRLTKPIQACSRQLSHTRPSSMVSFRQFATNKRAFTSTRYTFNKLELGSTSKVLALATLGGSSSLIFKRPAQCQAYAQPVREPVSDFGNLSESANEPLLHKGELTFGAFLGLCTGFFAKKISKLIAVCIGLGFVFLQYMSSKGYVNVNWSQMEKGYKGQLDTDRDGKVTMHDLSVKRDSFMDMLTSNIQFKSSFLVGFALGVRYG